MSDRFGPRREPVSPIRWQLKQPLDATNALPLTASPAWPDNGVAASTRRPAVAPRNIIPDFALMPFVIGTCLARALPAAPRRTPEDKLIPVLGGIYFFSPEGPWPVEKSTRFFPCSSFFRSIWGTFTRSLQSLKLPVVSR